MTKPFARQNPLPANTGEMTREQIDRLLYNQAYGRLATTDGKRPYIVPITFAYDGEYIYGQTNAGAKLDLVRRNPFVCFEADNMVGMRDWECVIIHGQFEELTGEEAEEAREILFNRVFPLLSNNMIHAFQHEVTSTLDNTGRVKETMYRIKIDKISGRYQKQ